MTPYKNLGGDSGIESYEISSDAIHVRFKSGRERDYLYNNITPGHDIVEQMKSLAEDGQGLNSYISTAVKTRFYRKW